MECQLRSGGRSLQLALQYQADLHERIKGLDETVAAQQVRMHTHRIHTGAPRIQHRILIWNESMRNPRHGVHCYPCSLIQT